MCGEHFKQRDDEIMMMASEWTSAISSFCKIILSVRMRVKRHPVVGGVAAQQSKNVIA